jgi:hypothetical protein
MLGEGVPVSTKPRSTYIREVLYWMLVLAVEMWVEYISAQLLGVYIFFHATATGPSNSESNDGNV